MSTAFDLPANPTLGQIATLPSGDQVQWNGFAWTPIGNVPITYPLGITMGGTGANNAASARTNLGIDTAIATAVNTRIARAGDAMTGVLGIVSGTVAAPGLAFSAEAGFGWYRTGISTMAVAAAGAQQVFMDFSNPASTAVSYYPRAAGASNIILNDQASGVANRHSFVIQQSAGGVTLQLNNLGTAAKLSMLFNGALSYVFDAIGAFPASGWQVGGAMRAFYDGSQANYLAMGSASSAWAWQWNNSSGRLSWLGSASNELIGIDAGGNVNFAGQLHSNTNVQAAGQVSGASVVAVNTLLANPGGGMQFNPGNYWTGAAYLCYISAGDPGYGQQMSYRFEHQPGVWAGHGFYVGGVPFQMTNSGTVIANGTTLTSDRATKTNIKKVGSLAHLFKGLVAYEYDRTNGAVEIDGSPVHELGLIAQDLKARVPLTTRQHNATKDFPNPMLGMDVGAMLAALSQTMGEVLERVETLEIQTLTPENK